jgi:hypothetical protein
VTFKESGWFVVRTIVEQDIRFAQTAPYYVEIGQASAGSARPG